MTGRKWEARGPTEEWDLAHVCKRKLGPVGVGKLDHLSEDAAEGPHVNSLVVIFLVKDYLRSAVPSGGHVRGHASTAAMLLDACAREAEVAYQDVAVLVDEHVCWLEVPVDHSSGMQVVDAAKNVVEDSLEMLVIEGE